MVRERLDSPAASPPVRDVKRIMDDAVILAITFHRAGIRRKADIGLVATEADKSMLGLTKAIVDSPEYTAAMRVVGDARSWLDKRTLPSPLKRGTYLVPLSMVGDVYDHIAEVVEEYRAKVEEFLLVYPAQVERAREHLADQFQQDNYPTVETLRAAFWIDHQLLDFGVPSAEKIGRELWAREKERAERSWADAVGEIQEALRSAFRGLVGHLAERLEPNADGSKKIFKDTAVEKLVEFIDLFKNRNLTGDVELEGLVAQARNVLAGKRPDALRKSSTVRGEVAGEMARVSAALDKLLADAPRRKISFEED
jgi:hypothetical protein